MRKRITAIVSVCLFAGIFIYAHLFFLHDVKIQAEDKKPQQQEVSWQITVWDHGSAGHKNSVFVLSSTPALEGDIWHCRKLEGGELYAHSFQSTVESTIVGSVNAKKR